MASSAVTATPRWQELAAQRRAVIAFPAAVRGYADDATTRNGDDLANSSGATTDKAQPAGAEAPLQAQRVPAEKSIVGSGPATGGGSGGGAAKAADEKSSPFRQLELLASGQVPFEPYYDGHKFGLTTAMTRASTAKLPEEDGLEEYLASGEALPGIGKVQDRYDELISQLTRLMMRHGKLAKAQRVCFSFFFSFSFSFLFVILRPIMDCASTHFC